MSTSSDRATRIAEELLGLDSFPRTSVGMRYGAGSAIFGPVIGFYYKHKFPIMIIGGVAVAGLVGYFAYDKWIKK